MAEYTYNEDIDALAAFLLRVRDGDDPWGDPDHAKDWSRALTALIAERDAVVAERDRLKRRVAVLESQEFTLPRDPFRDPDRDLRERLVCAALPVVIADFYNCSPNKRYDLAWHIQSAVDAADAAIAAMRKGEQNDK